MVSLRARKKSQVFTVWNMHTMWPLHVKEPFLPPNFQERWRWRKVSARWRTPRPGTFFYRESFLTCRQHRKYHMGLMVFHSIGQGRVKAGASSLLRSEELPLTSDGIEPGITDIKVSPSSVEPPRARAGD